MTNEEAIKRLKNIDIRGALQEDYDALYMAIKALEQEPNQCDSCIHSEEQDGASCYECVKGMADNFEEEIASAIAEEELCDSCANRGCCIFQSGIVRNHCGFYKAESEEA